MAQSRYSKIHSSIWDSTKFNKLNTFEKMVFMYFLTCPHGNSIGLYKIKEGYAILDLNCKKIDYLKAIDTLSKLGMIVFDRTDSMIYISNYVKYNPYTNPKHAKGSVSIANNFIESQLYSHFYNDLKVYSEKFIDEFRKPIHSLSIDYAKGISTDTDTDTMSDHSDDIPYKDIVNYLNKKLDTKYQASTQKTRDSIKARINEGYCLEDFKKVIDIKSKEWLNTNMSNYLRPETLFSNKFEGYLNQKDMNGNNSYNNQKAEPRPVNTYIGSNDILMEQLVKERDEKLERTGHV